MAIQSRQRIIRGDCREVLKSPRHRRRYTACVTDPPYELGFMGKDWDKRGIAFNPETWRRVYDALVPGAFLLAFGGTRTFHRIAVAIEDAGFGIRDCVMWVYGSGFPKSYDISKAIDKAAGAEREVVGWAQSRNRPDSEDGHRVRMNTSPGEYDVTAPATPSAALWDGWGTALKPAWEPIIVAMKPIKGTFAANALGHGVAGINVDGCRVEANDDLKPVFGGSKGKKQADYDSGVETVYGDSDKYLPAVSPYGRWPANLIHDGSEEVLEGFPETGASKASSDHSASSSPFLAHQWKRGASHDDNGGSAARFFYCAKASKRERTMGGRVDNPHPTIKPLALMEYLLKLVTYPERNLVLDPFLGSGSTLLACKTLGLDALGIELDPQSALIATRRLRNHD